jgi:hypothetical protein
MDAAFVEVKLQNDVLDVNGFTIAVLNAKRKVRFVTTF